MYSCVFCKLSVFYRRFMFRISVVFVVGGGGGGGEGGGGLSRKSHTQTCDLRIARVAC